MVKQNRFLLSVDSWWTEFKIFLLEKHKIREWSVIFNNAHRAKHVKWDKMTFSSLLSDFLFSPSGAKYREHLVFNGSLICNKPAPEVVATSTAIVYRRFHGRDEYMPAIEGVERIIKSLNFSSTAFSFSHVYRTWETVEIIGNK